MSRDTQLKERWEQLVNILSNQFSQGRFRFRRHYLFNGVQELGKVHQEFKRRKKIKPDAICRLLEPYGFMNSSFFDEGWPHYKVKDSTIKAGEQSVLMKEAIVNYFVERELIQ
jgi:hypothetical protein